MLSSISCWLNKLKEEVTEVEAEVDKLGDLTTKDIIYIRDWVERIREVAEAKGR